MDIPEAGKGKKNAIFKLLMCHLSSDTLEGLEDQGFSTFLKLHSFLISEKKVKSEPEPETGTTLSSGTPEEAKPLFDVRKLKDFKINGTIGGPEKKDSLSYTSLCYQISNGQKLGYADEIVCAAVLRAISPGNNLRTYLESKTDLNVTSLLDIMRSHFRERDSTSVFTELSNAAQGVSESCLDFVIRSMCLRQKVLALGQEEGYPFDENLVQARFLHTLEVGIRNSNIRSELREVFKTKLPDEELLKAVTEATSRETERSRKLASSRKPETAIVNQVQADKNCEVNNVKKKKDNDLQTQILELRANQAKELAALRSDLCEIKNVLTQQTGSCLGNVDGFQQRQNLVPNVLPPRFKMRKKYKCQDCEQNRVYRCVHCFQCGSTQHRVVNCPEKKNGN